MTRIALVAALSIALTAAAAPLALADSPGQLFQDFSSSATTSTLASNGSAPPAQTSQASANPAVGAN